MTFVETTPQSQTESLAFDFDLQASERLPVEQVLKDEKVIGMIREMRQSNSTSGYAVGGNATAGTGATYGGYFFSQSTSGAGIFGWATATSGSTSGGSFLCASTSGTRSAH